MRNRGTTPCRRVHIGVVDGGRAAGKQDRFTLAPGRSASVDVRASVARGAVAGATASLTFQAVTTEDPVPGNNRAT